MFSQNIQDAFFFTTDASEFTNEETVSQELEQI